MDGGCNCAYLLQSIMGPEAKIEAYLKQQVKKAGGIAFKFVSPGYSGVTDRIVLIPGGTVVFVEVKAEKGSLTALQVSFGRLLEYYKAEYAVVKSREDIDRLIEKYFWHLS